VEEYPLQEAAVNHPDTLPDLNPHPWYMEKALQQARIAESLDEVPIGAVIVHQGRIIAAAHNQREMLRDPTAHAEMLAITQAAEALGDWRLLDCALYVTLEPCPMCAGAIVNARIPLVVFGASDPKAGAVVSLYQMLGDSRLNHCCEVNYGVMAAECGDLLTRFFRRQRQMGKK
jgi:tRNA(adenine34) deaminase